MKSILVVGQGIVGTLLAEALLRRGVQVTMADAGEAITSSRIAAGVINPVTGWRFVKSWQFESFFPVAKATYEALEVKYDVKIWHDAQIVRLLSTPEEINNWSARTAQLDYEAYLSIRQNAGSWSGLIPDGLLFGAITRAARVDFPVLLAAAQDQLRLTGHFVAEKIDTDGVGDLLRQYDQVVFCGGYEDATNSYFPGLDWQISKGEALLLHIPDLPDSLPNAPVEMLKKTVVLVPQPDCLVWAGSNFDPAYTDHAPSAAGRAYIEGHLGQMLRCPYEVVDHRAAVRPTVKDRRPFCLQSPVDERVFLLNGMGAKGALLGPYFAEEMAILLDGESQNNFTSSPKSI
jgi:glycine oxidase